MKWVIVEDALRDRKGHWLEYVSTFVRELRALGDEVVVLCDRQAQGFVMEQTGARPVLPESIWHRMGDGTGALKRYLRVPWHAVATFFAMRKFFKKFNHRGHGEHGVGGKREIKCETGRMDEAQCNAQEICAGAFESDSLTSKLAESRVSESPIRCANGPASSPVTSHSLQATTPEASLPATSYPLPATSSPPDWIFVPTVLVHHLLGWWVLLKAGSVPKESRVLLFFPNLPIRLDDIGLAHWSGGPTTKLMAWLFTNLKKEVEGGRVVLGVETHAMRRALEALIQMRVVYLPHPVEAQGETRVERRESRASSPATSYSPPGTSAKPIIFGCYGAARWEKGSDIFQEAIKLILKNEVAGEKWQLTNGENQFLPDTSYPLLVTAAGRPLRFAIQWVEDFRDDSGNLVSIDPLLHGHSQVEVIGQYFEGDEYEWRLAATDVMVLPYRNPYQLRVSRVVIEAMLNGMPVVATRGTTLFEQAEEYGVVVGCEEGDAESLAGAILEVAERFESMRASAEEKVNAAAQSFSVGYFRDLLTRNGKNH
jgi:glycosyltransferase involved in cell wall biosynthesis